MTSDFHFICFRVVALFGLVQTKPVQSQTASLRPGPVRPSGRTGLVESLENHAGELVSTTGDAVLCSVPKRPGLACATLKADGKNAV